MGVVYKLTTQVIDFILAEKAANPALSCRKLSDLVQQNYHIMVSKSSISAILKEAHLNSPVGRRQLSEKPRKKTVKRRRKKKLIRSDSLALLKPFDSSEDLLKLPAPPSKGKELVDDIGYVFIKSAEWEMSNHSLLAELLKGRISFLDEIQIKSLVERLVFKEFFNKTDISADLWEKILTQKDKRIIDVEGVLERLNTIDDWDDAVVQLVVDAQYCMTKVAFIRLELEDDSDLLLDVEMSSVWTKKLDLPFYNTVNNSTRVVFDQIINNVQSAVFCFCPILDVSENLSQKAYCAKQFLDLCASFENKAGKRLKRIFLLDVNGDEIALFDVIPQKKRYFISCLWPWQPEFQPLIRSIRTSKVEKLVDIFFDENLYYSEYFTTIPLEDDFQPRLGLRIFPLRENKASAPFGLVLTNAPQDLMSAHDVVYSYYARWPNLQRGFNYSVGKIISKEAQPLISLITNTYKININTNKNFENIIQRAKNLLANFSWQTYFSSGKKSLLPVDLMDIITPLNGTINTDENNIQVLLMPDNDYACLEDLISAASRINERNIVDFQGRRLMIKIFSRR